MLKIPATKTCYKSTVIQVIVTIVSSCYQEEPKCHSSSDGVLDASFVDLKPIVDDGPNFSLFKFLTIFLTPYFL